MFRTYLFKSIVCKDYVQYILFDLEMQDLALKIFDISPTRL